MKPAVGIRWARTLDERPNFIPINRPKKGVKGEGLRYEKALAKGLGAKFRHGLWWEYRDAGGIGYCQTDFFGKAKEWIILLESKLTWTMDAEEQLHELYVPVVAAALGIPRAQVLPIVVCKYLTSGASRPVSDTLRDAILRSMEISAPFCSVWHHLGGVPLLRELEKEKVYG
jgi:hypothetical protein